MKIEDTKQRKKQFNSLVEKIAQGDNNALENFYTIYGKLIYSVALSVSKSSYLAEEIVNDILVKICQLAPTLYKINNPIGWLYSITSNLAKDRIKTEKPIIRIYDIPQNDNNIDRVFAKDSFYYYIALLTEDEQQIMILRFIQDLSFKMISKEINKSLSTVSSTYYRAIDKLKNIIKES